MFWLVLWKRIILRGKLAKEETFFADNERHYATHWLSQRGANQIILQHWKLQVVFAAIVKKELPARQAGSIRNVFPGADHYHGTALGGACK